MDAMTVLSVTASVGRIGPTSTVEAGIGAGIMYETRAASGDNGGQVLIEQPTRSSTNYGTYCWQALAFATVLAAVPILLYGCWAASGFLVRNTSCFGLAWIFCFVISFCIALYYEPNDGFQYLQNCPLALATGTQMALVSSDADTPELNLSRLPAPASMNANVTRSQPTASTSVSARSQGQVAGVSQSEPTASTYAASQASVMRQPQSTTASMKAKSQVPVAVPASEMNSKAQIKQGHDPSKPNVGGAQFLTPVESVFIQDTE